MKFHDTKLENCFFFPHHIVVVLVSELTMEGGAVVLLAMRGVTKALESLIAKIKAPENNGSKTPVGHLIASLSKGKDNSSGEKHPFLILDDFVFLRINKADASLLSNIKNPSGKHPSSCLH